MRERREHFIGGKWLPPATGGEIRVHSPADLKYVGQAPDGSPADMDLAVAAAREAFDRGPWPRMASAERAVVLRRMAAILRAQADEVAELLCDEMGAPITFLKRGGGDGVSRLFEYYADLAETWPFEAARQGALGPAVIRQEPVGVVAAITPWNGPMYILALKVAPALAAGCVVVAKPAQETPLDAFCLADAAEQAGLPPGVLNIIPGGREVGDYLVRHPGIDKVSFTGSTAAGRKIGAICGEQLKRCGLELGGKSAAVMLDDADITSLVQCAVPLGLAFNNGQACAALTRVIVPRARHNEVVDAFVDVVQRLTVGDPRDPATELGPLIAERQRDRVERYIALGRAEGATLAVGGGRPAGLDKGWYVEPTVFSDAANDMTIARDEIFGPVGVIIPYDGGDEAAIELANASTYGLGGAVFSADSERAYRAASQIRTGTIGVNMFGVDPLCPFGGFKGSGIGREMGPEGLAGFIEYKSVFGFSN
ncbi:MAG: Aldehyde Dehydrogenase [Phenylobacterium sp.]|uniref:aldehyde dehydrogenase n=1 Tax=Phenylobacterium sp. TaxID=1871053 RepID=UPI00261813D6|nr:aldehyde dehydrogenase [Phenylobacterium sp.]MDB5497296.1 Aldehyde Dehydrogenase [Phenylobacterium sp.]